MTQEFDLYAVREEHELLRESVRALVESKIAPFAAAVDHDARYPQEAHDALHAADMAAIHIPEEYGGAGADALALRRTLSMKAVFSPFKLSRALNSIVWLPAVTVKAEVVKLA